VAMEMAMEMESEAKEGREGKAVNPNRGPCVSITLPMSQAHCKDSNPWTHAQSN
jgi:hypothetical protein